MGVVCDSFDLALHVSLREASLHMRMSSDVMIIIVPLSLTVAIYYTLHRLQGYGSRVDNQPGIGCFQEAL